MIRHPCREHDREQRPGEEARPDHTGGSSDPGAMPWCATRRAASDGDCPVRTRGDRRAPGSPSHLRSSRGSRGQNTAASSRSRGACRSGATWAGLPGACALTAGCRTRQTSWWTAGRRGTTDHRPRSGREDRDRDVHEQGNRCQPGQNPEHQQRAADDLDPADAGAGMPIRAKRPVPITAGKRNF